MRIEIHLTADEPLRGALATIAEAFINATAADPVEAPAAPKPKPAAKAKANPAPEPEPASPAEEPAPAPAESGETPTKDELRAAMQAFAKSNGRQAALVLLQKHGAKSVSDVPEEKRAAVIADATAA